ncbi:MAG: ABC transporter ATP-binding protein [Fibrobacteria bacterium]|nr:ABC transporter ATP-binding protein [Fibrobacteria bacterium]
MTNTVITVEKINKSFGALKAVNNLSFKVNRAECFGFLGPNGAGKTTLMQMLYGVARRDDAQASTMDVFGLDPYTQELDVKALCGVVPQEDNLDSQLNVYQNLLIYSRFYGMETKQAGERIDELLDFLELSEKKDVRIKKLSGGMKRRLVIARSLLHRPKMLILDEPTTGLDPQVRHLIWQKIRELKKEGVTILLTTHYMDEAYQICDNILIMNQGKRIIEGPPRRLLEENIEPYVMETAKSGDKELEASWDTNGIRRDEVQNIPRYYAGDFARLKTLAKQMDTDDMNIRRTNLEDLFLRITGKCLNEKQ